MKGYWNDPTATKAAIKDGWLHTGDVGVLEEDGSLRITDRKKDIIVISGGALPGRAIPACLAIPHSPHLSGSGFSSTRALSHAKM